MMGSMEQDADASRFDTGGCEWYDATQERISMMTNNDSGEEQLRQ
ncbi:MAG: hypothetical protein NTV22_13200 [bacterium]|nr:hypothetical protein [bacterium]